jgi:hypothetical protein
MEWLCSRASPEAILFLFPTNELVIRNMLPIACCRLPIANPFNGKTPSFGYSFTVFTECEPVTGFSQRIFVWSIRDKP